MKPSVFSGNFCFIDEVVPGIRWDAKYFSSDNFTGSKVNGYNADRVTCSNELASALVVAQKEAQSRGCELFLWDAYRPQRAVNRFMAWAKEPEDFLTKDKHYPGLTRAEMFEKGYVCERSGHSRGGTVDLTLCRISDVHDDEVELLEMGTGFDFMDPISHHGAAGISAEATRNRQVLREIMELSGFVHYPYEWWHYTLRDEPYPDTYFDFVL